VEKANIIFTNLDSVRRWHY